MGENTMNKYYAELDELGQEWYDAIKNENGTKDGLDMARKNSVWEKIFKICYSIYAPQIEADQNFQDIYSNFISSEIFKFDVNKSTLSKFITYRLKKRIIDNYKVERKKLIKEQSLSNGIMTNEDNDDENNNTIENKLAASKDQEPSELLDSQEKNYELIVILTAAIIDLKSKLKGRENNPIKINYYKIFFSDMMSELLQNTKNISVYKRKEYDLFKAMKITFLDFFTIETCRTIEEIGDSMIKPYGAMVDGRPMDAPPKKRPLPNDVYTSYMEKIENKTVNDSAISMQHKSFSNYIKEILIMNK